MVTETWKKGRTFYDIYFLQYFVVDFVMLDFFSIMHGFLKDKNAGNITRPEYLSSTSLHQNTVFF